MPRDFVISGPALSCRLFCDDGTVLNLHHPMLEPLATWIAIECLGEESNVHFHLIVLNLNLYKFTWLMALLLEGLG